MAENLINQEEDIKMRHFDIILPRKSNNKKLRHSFHWTLDGHLTKAHDCFLHLTEPPHDEYWHFIGTTGTLEEHGNYFSFNLTVPNMGEELLERTYTLEDGLEFYHVYSVTYPDYIELRSFPAIYAELAIRLKPKGKVKGDFKGRFNFDNKVLAPEGAFELFRH